MSKLGQSLAFGLLDDVAYALFCLLAAMLITVVARLLHRPTHFWSQFWALFLELLNPLNWLFF